MPGYMHRVASYAPAKRGVKARVRVGKLAAAENLTPAASLLADVSNRGRVCEHIIPDLRRNFM